MNCCASLHNESVLFLGPSLRCCVPLLIKQTKKSPEAAASRLDKEAEKEDDDNQPAIAQCPLCADHLPGRGIDLAVDSNSQLISLCLANSKTFLFCPSPPYFPPSQPSTIGHCPPCWTVFLFPSASGNPHPIGPSIAATMQVSISIASLLLIGIAASVTAQQRQFSPSRPKSQHLAPQAVAKAPAAVTGGEQAQQFMTAPQCKCKDLEECAKEIQKLVDKCKLE